MPIDCAVDLRFGPSGEWRRTSATNISMSGMFVRTSEMHPKGSVLDVKFELQNGQPAIRARAEVLWNRVRETGLETPQGAGVRFLDLDLDSKYAISRLVDRFQRLGGMPFNLAAAEDAPAAPGGASRSRQGTLALAFLAGLAAGAAGSWWLVARAGAGTAGVVQASELAPKSVRRTGPAETPAEGPAETLGPAESAGDEGPAESAGDAGAIPTGDPAAGIEAAVEAWARAWAAKDADRYLAAYAADFEPASGSPRDAWQAHRRERLARPGAVEVRLSALEIETPAAGRAVARFDQTYTAPGYRDRVRKLLELIRQDQEWKILREEVLAQLPLHR